MKRIVVLLLFSAGLQAQTTLPPSQMRSTIPYVGTVVCFPETPTSKAECLAVRFDPSIEIDRSVNPPLMKSVIIGAPVPNYVGGSMGAIITLNQNNPPEIDIVTSVIPRKAQSETISGLWSYSQGLTLSPIALPSCDANTNKGRLLTDAVDGVLKYCDGAWHPILPHVHWQFRTSTAILTAPQSTFNILDPTIVAGSLEVYRNGVLMTLGTDYVQAGLGASAPVQFTAAQSPITGDTVTLKYMW